MQLNKIQEQFKGMVIGDHESVDQDSNFNALFISDAIPVEKRLHYYRDSVLEKLIKVLAITFPTVQTLVGEEFFASVARLYARQNPPRSGNLNLYGETFPGFIGALQETQSLPYIHDVAHYDWLFNIAYYADDDAPLTFESLQNIDPQTLGDKKFPLRSSVHTIQSNFPLTVIREFCGNDNNDETLNLDQAEETLLLYRPHLKIQVLHIDTNEYIILNALKGHKTLSQALDNTLKQDPNFNFQDFLQKFIPLETFLASDTNSISR